MQTCINEDLSRPITIKPTSTDHNLSCFSAWSKLELSSHRRHLEIRAGMVVTISRPLPSLRSLPSNLLFLNIIPSSSPILSCTVSLSFLKRAPLVRRFASAKTRRTFKAAAAPLEFMGDDMVHDVVMSGVATVVALGLLQFWEELAKRGVFKQVTNRKLVHISIGLAFMLFWPLFSSGPHAPFLAAFAPGINIIRMLLLGLGVMKSEGTVKSMTRNGDYRELLKGPLFYACTITLSTIVFWRTSPVGLAVICNLCAGDGVADIVGRRFGREKLPYNQNKSFAGTIAMGAAGFLASIMYMHYFAAFGLLEESWNLILGFLLVSLMATIVESLPISTKLDDNLTVPLASALVGCLVF